MGWDSHANSRPTKKETTTQNNLAYEQGVRAFEIKVVSFLSSIMLNHGYTIWQSASDAEGGNQPFLHVKRYLQIYKSCRRNISFVRS